MPDNKEISALTTAEQTSNNDLFETSIPNAMTDTGYISRKQSVTMLEQQMLGNTQYNTELPNFTAGNRTIFKALEEARSSGGGGASVIQKTMAEYTALPSADKMNGSIYKITDKALIYCLDEEYHAVLEITSADYAQLTSAEKNNGTLYVITDEETTAADIPYSAGVSVADKLDEVSVSYDTTEKVIGVWQDGKPLYEKTINWDGFITNSQEINTGITNPKFVFFDTVIVTDDTFNNLCFPYIGTNATIGGYINSSGTKIHIDCGSYWSNHKLYLAFKIRYTKTTD